MYVCVPVRVYEHHVHAGAQRSQKRAPDTLELELQAVVVQIACQEPNSDPLQELCALLTASSQLDDFFPFTKRISWHKYMLEETMLIHGWPGSRGEVLVCIFVALIPSETMLVLFYLSVEELKLSLVLLGLCFVTHLHPHPFSYLPRNIFT